MIGEYINVIWSSIVIYFTQKKKKTKKLKRK